MVFVVVKLREAKMTNAISPINRQNVQNRHHTYGAEQSLCRRI